MKKIASSSYNIKFQHNKKNKNYIPIIHTEVGPTVAPLTGISEINPIIRSIALTDV